MRRAVSIIAVALALLAPGQAWGVTPVTGGGGGVTAVVTDPANACADGIDNDGDGRSDHADRGCADDTPTSETFTGPIPMLTIARAKSLAAGEVTSRFGGLLDQIKLTRTRCTHAGNARVWCSVDWTRVRRHRVKVRIQNYVNPAAKRIDTTTEIRA